MFKDLWHHQINYAQTRRRSLESELIKKERQVQTLLNRIMDAELPSVINAYEARIKNVEDEKIIIREKITNCGRPLKGYDETYRTAMCFLSNPYKLWASKQLEHKRAVLKLAFADKLTYVRNEGYRTAKTTFPFKVLVGFLDQDCIMAPRKGVEPLAFPLGGGRSIQLSYRG